MKLLTTTQHSEAWWESRKGNVTGSNMAAVLGFLKRGDKKGGENADRAAYRIKIVTEILTGQPVMDGFLSKAMQWGSDHEDLARAAYEFQTGNDVRTVGFGLHDTLERFGGSCDALVGDDGILEIKCPESTTHVKWMFAGVPPPEHEPQMSAYLSITGRKYVDFCSFDPRMPEAMQLFIVRLHRDEARIAEIEAAVVKFLAEVDEAIERLRLLYPSAPPQERLRDQLEASLISDEDFAYSPGMAYAPDNATATEG